MENIFIPDYPIIKEAGMLDAAIMGAVNKVKDTFDFSTHPYEKVFSVLNIALSFQLGLFFGVIMSIADHAGYGLSGIGRMIDNDLKTSSGASNLSGMNLSDANLKAASDSTISKLFSPAKDLLKKIQNSLGLNTKSALKDIIMIKGAITPNDVISASQIAFHKEAAGVKVGVVKGLWGFVKNPKTFASVAGVLLLVIKGIAKVIMGLGLVGAVAGATGIKSRTEKEHDPMNPSGFKPEDDPLLPQRLKSQTLQYYKNTDNSVEDVLIKHLNANVANFSMAFQSVNKKPLKGSSKMRSVLTDVALLNWGDINEINKRETFVAPKILNLAIKLLPEAKYKKLNHNPLAKKPGLTAPVGPKKPLPKPKLQEKPKDDLNKLLQGV